MAARIGNAGGVVIGLGEGENFIASDIPAILEHTNRMVFLDSRQMAVIKKDSLSLQTVEGDPVDYKVEVINLDPVSAVKGNYRHFMQKEIHEQPRSLLETLAGRIDLKNNSVLLPTLNMEDVDINKIDSMKIVACGTANHAATGGKILD